MNMPQEVKANKTAGNADVEVSKDAVRVLIVATVLFGLFFAVWTMFGIVGLKMKKELGLADGEFALLIAIPVLTGSLLRIPVGLLTDRIGGRNMMMALLIFAALPTYLMSRVHSYDVALILALLIGFAGTSFAAGIAWVSAWYPVEKQGFALGVFGLGNIGAALTGLVAPSLITLVAAGGAMGGVIGGGWRLIPTMYAFLLVFLAILTPFITPSPDRKPAQGRKLGAMLKPLGVMRVWRFGFYYLTVFGGYVALTLWLPKYYQNVYNYSLREAGLMTALFIFPASLSRPFGGRYADKYGARPVILISFVVMAITALILGFGVSVTPFVIIVLVMGLAMGIGMAAVFTYIPNYFTKDVGAVGGLVGALGALGGFILPLSFAWVKSHTGGRPENIWYVLLGLVLLSMLMLSVAVARLRAGEFSDEVETE
jgi:NNP family nitrate/nitrite transporter-like MFS transporter